MQWWYGVGLKNMMKKGRNGLGQHEAGRKFFFIIFYWVLDKIVSAHKGLGVQHLKETFRR